MKKILFMTVGHPMFGIGGAEIQTYTLAKQFSKNGWKVYFLSKKGTIKYSFDNSGINLLLYKSHNWLIDKVILCALLLYHRPNYIYYRFHKDDLFFSNLAKVWGGKTIWAPISDEYCDKSANTKTRRKKSISHLNFYLDLRDWFFTQGVLNVSSIIVQSKAQETIVKEEFGRNSTIIYNSTEVQTLHKNRKGFIIFIASIKFMKRPELFCELAGRLRQFKFVLVGTNYQDKKSAELLYSLMVKNGVEYMGPLPPEKVKKILKESKLLINTSDFEGFPSTFVEAFASGCPVVSLRINPDEIFTNNRIGICCDGNFQLMIDTVHELMANQQKWDTYSLNCYKFAQEYLDTKKIVKKMELLLESL